jgi:hypothetical protein
MTDRSNTLVNASLSMQSTLDLRFLVSLKNVGLENSAYRYHVLMQHC